MRVLIQRVSAASVTVADEVVGKAGAGLLLLVGIRSDDGAEDLEWLARKIVNLRIFNDEQGVMNRSVLEACGEILAVSQFTLYGSTAKGNRPSWSNAAAGPIAEPLFNRFVEMLSAMLGRPVATGRFGADMKVALTNDGPVSLWLDSRVRE
jgi:D-tyrosyl-tRNA(Tyr) deacylase